VHRHHPHHQITTELPASPRVTISLLGGFRVTVNDVPTATRGWARRSAAALVKILALEPGHRLHRETVMDLLWPDESPERCAPRLHKAAHLARLAAGHHQAIVLRDELVWLFPGADLTVDAAQFEQRARVALRERDPGVAHEALAWYGGELLPADRYEDWASDRREALALRRLDVLRVAGEWRDVAELDPTDEEAQAHLVHRHLAAGDANAALRQYEHLERVLDRDLGAQPQGAARNAGQEARRLASVAGQETCSPPRVDALLAELADLVRRQSALLAELSAVGAVASSAELVGAA
jgi:DNA-binding SARP family transcriptional activator